MGRTDAVAFTQQWAERARQLGATVDFEPGWDTRGNGSAANYEGAIVHHTASPSSAARPFPTRGILINGRAGLPGPLCNVAGPWCPDGAPRLVVISARPANHAGASGGRSMGPLPVTNAFNARTFGLEVDYSGLVPMAPGQYRAALVFSRAVCDVLGRSPEYVRAHAETSVTGKWDPGYANGKTYDMAAFRRAVANFAAQEDEDDMFSNDDAVRLSRIENAVGALIAVSERPLEAERRLTARISALQSLVQQLAERQGSTIDMAAVEDAVERGVADAISAIETTVTVRGDQPA